MGTAYAIIADHRYYGTVRLLLYVHVRRSVHSLRGPVLDRLTKTCRRSSGSRACCSPVDNYAALKWVHAHAAELGIDRSRIAVDGESAGGGHAASLAIHARDRNEVPIVFQLLIYPGLDVDHELFVPQRHHQVYAHSPSRRDVAGQGRHADQQRRDTEKGGGVVSANPIQHAGKEACQQQRSDCS